MTLINDEYFKTYVGSATRSDMFAKYNPDIRAQAIRTASDQIRSAALNVFSAESFDALTISTAPEEMKMMCARLALGFMTEGDSARSQQIVTLYESATRYLGILAAGKAHYDGAVLQPKNESVSAFEYDENGPNPLGPAALRAHW